MLCVADICNAPVNRPGCVETTAMGAAYLAGLAVGYWKDKEAVGKNRVADKVFVPQLEEHERKEKIRGWEKAVKCSFGWEEE